MLTTDTVEKALNLLDLGYTFPSITEETGITTEDAEAVHVAWFTGTSEQVSRELQLAGVLEAAAAKLRSGQGWDESTTGDVLGEILHVYPAQVRKALAMALLAGNLQRGQRTTLSVLCMVPQQSVGHWIQWLAFSSFPRYK
jgi:hypothetical protein